MADAELACLFDFLAPGGDSCGDRGECVNSSLVSKPNGMSELCLCDQEGGFQSVGDLALQMLDCDISETATKVFWGFTVVFSLVTLIVSCAYALVVLCNMNRYKRHIWRNFTFYGPVVLGSFLITALSLKKASEAKNRRPDSLIGEDVLTTFLYCTGISLWWISVYLLLERLATLYRSVLSSSNKNKSSVLDYPFNLICGVTVFLSCLPILLLLFPASSLVIAMLHNLGLTLVNAAFLFYFAPRFISNIMEVLQERVKYLKDTKSENAVVAAEILNETVVIEELVQKLKPLRIQSLLQGTIMVSLGIIFAIWPFMTRRSTYLIAINLCCLSLIVLFSVFVVGNQVWSRYTTTFKTIHEILSKTIKIATENGSVVGADLKNSSALSLLGEHSNSFRKLVARKLSSNKQVVDDDANWRTPEARANWWKKTLEEDQLNGLGLVPTDRNPTDNLSEVTDLEI